MLDEVLYLNYVKFNKAPPLTPQHRQKRILWYATVWTRPPGSGSTSSGRTRKSLTSTDHVGVQFIGLFPPPSADYFLVPTRKRMRNDLGVVFLETKFESGGYTWSNINREKYYVLKEALLPFGNKKHVGKFVFQQDNASCHTSNYT